MGETLIYTILNEIIYRRIYVQHFCYCYWQTGFAYKMCCDVLSRYVEIYSLLESLVVAFNCFILSKQCGVRNRPMEKSLTVFTYFIFARQARRLFEGGAYLSILPDKFTFSIFLFNGALSISSFSYGLILN